MKRINPKTKRLFKMGDKRNDGYVFVGYGSKIRKEGSYKGFYKEGFFSPKKFKEFKQKQTIEQRLIKNPSKKGKKKINPSTGKPWKRGEKNKNGNIFDGYKTTWLYKNGYFPLNFISSSGDHNRRLRMAIYRRKKGYPKNFKLNFNYIQKIFPKNFICSALKIKMSWGGNIQTSPSLDRINNKKGYTRDNVHWISYRANSIKCDATYDQIIKVGRWLKAKGC